MLGNLQKQASYTAADCKNYSLSCKLHDTVAYLHFKMEINTRNTDDTKKYINKSVSEIRPETKKVS